MALCKFETTLEVFAFLGRRSAAANKGRLVAGLQPITPERVSVERAVIGEYLVANNALDTVPRETLVCWTGWR